MKKPLLFVTLSLFFSLSQAQVDRSRPPQPPPLPTLTLEQPQRFTLKNGLTVMVVENHKWPKVSIGLTLDHAPGMQKEKAGIAALTSRLLGKGSTSIPKADFYEEIDFLGARLHITDEGASASSLSRYFPRVLELMAEGALNPRFTQEEFEKERAKLITGIRSEEKDVSAIAARVQAALAYGKNHPYGEFSTETSLNNITLADVTRHYESYFVPENAYLVVLGDVTFAEVKKWAARYFGRWTKATAPSFEYGTATNVPYTQINFVDVPHAVQSEVAVQYMVDLKMKDEAYLAAFLAGKVLGGGSQGRLFKNLREDKGYTYGAYCVLEDNKYGPVPFRAYTQVRTAATDSTIVQLLKEIDRIITTRVTEEELATVKAKYAGHFIRNLEKPETIATAALTMEIEDLPKDFYRTYLQRLKAVSIEEVQKAAERYFSTTKARVVVAGNGRELLDRLEKVTFKGQKLPVFYYDLYANPIGEPTEEVGVAEGMTGTKVLENYITAIGGKETLESVASYTVLAETALQGMTLEVQTRKTRNHQFMQEVKVMGQALQKEVLNGDEGYRIVQEERQPLSPEEQQKLQENSLLFPELHYLSEGTVTLQGIEAVGSRKAYRLKLTDEKTAFYDVETGLKLQEITTEAGAEPPAAQILSFEDYREVSGVGFPFTLSQQVGSQRFVFTVTEVKVNEAITPTDSEF